ncbi:hypothetical protein LPJ59_005694, partial [Coemansia sp. RSA 2399]
MVMPKQMRPAPRCDILCVLVVESTQQLQNVFPELYDTVITRIITQLRTPLVVDKRDAAPGAKKPTGPVIKATPCVRLGVVFFGDYYPYSTQTTSTQYFTSNYREFTKTVKAHRFREGGMLRCASTEGLVGALEMFDDFAEFDPEAHLTNVQQRHAILVTTTPPYGEPCRENVHMRYDNYTLDDVSKRMRELNISFSLIQERGKRIDPMEALLVSANVSTRVPLELPVAMSPHFDARLMGIDIQIPRELMDPVSAPQPIAPAAILPNNPPPVHIQPAIVPQPSSIQPQSLATVPIHSQQPLGAPATTPAGSLLPQKNKAAEAASSVAVAGMVSAASTKKQKTDTDVPSSSATMVPQASITTDEHAKPAVSRTKGRAKGSSGRKTSRASNSPAVAAKSTPPTTAAAAPVLTSAPHMHLQQQQPVGIGASPHIPVGSLQQPPQQPNAGNDAATAQTMLVNGWIQSLRSQGITSNDDIRT